MSKTKLFGILTMIFACVAVAFLMDTPKFLKYKRGDIKDYNTVAAGELQVGDLVEGTIDFAYDAIAEWTETNSVMGIETSTRTSKQYYPVYMYNQMYILYETGNSEQYATLNRLAEETYAYDEACWEIYESGSDDYSSVVRPKSTLALTGEVKAMPSGDLQNYFQEWYGEGFSTDCETAIIISYSNFDRFSWIIYVGAGSAVLAVVMLVLLIKTAVEEKRNREFSY